MRRGGGDDLELHTHNRKQYCWTVSGLVQCSLMSNKLFQFCNNDASVLDGFDSHKSDNTADDDFLYIDFVYDQTNNW